MATCIPQELVQKLKDSVLKGEIKPDAISKMLPAEREALKSILEDFVTDKLGIKVSSEEVKTIAEKAKKIDEAQKKLGDDLGNPNKIKENLEFFKAKKEMDDYLLSRSPANALQVLTGTIGRGMMLASVKSPVLNIGSNIEVGFSEALARRIANFQIQGADNAAAVDFVKMANKIYQETGYDISRMSHIADTGVGGTRVLGETIHAQGKGPIRKVGRIVEDTVFKQLMGAPDVAFSSAHFADSVNLGAMKTAKGDTAYAKELMQDAMRIQPKTPEGELLRAQGILDAQVATWTNTTKASQVSEGIRKILNKVSGDARLGDYLLPFVKTPANIIATGLDYAGMGIPKALIKGIKAFRTGELGSKEAMQGISRDLVRAGLGITGAAILASTLDNDDFVGAYDPARAQIEQLRNSNYNAIRVGNKWISTDWLGPLTVPVTAMMYARKYGETGGEKTFQYGKGLWSAVLNIPGISDIYDFVKNNAFKANQTLEEMTGQATDYITSELYSRLVPSFMSDLAKAVDPTVRQTGTGFEKIISKIPFLSKTLQPKTNIFGEQITGEPAWSDILFGSRVKTDKDTELIEEIRTVSENVDKPVNFTNWDKSSSKTLAQFKEKMGQEKFNQAKIEYGQELKLQLEKAFANSAYDKLTDEEKIKIINEQDQEAMDKIFKKYGFHYKKAPSIKLPKL